MNAPCVCDQPIRDPRNARQQAAFVLGRSLGGQGLPAALRAVRSNPAIRVTVFESNWSVVDQTRADIAAAGLEARVTARHVAAWRWALTPGRRAA